MANHTTILLVEDDPLILTVLFQIVRRAVPPSVEILTAQNGEEGLLRAREAHPDVIITDLMMPKMDGYEMVQSLRQEPADHPVRVIGVSCANNFDPTTVNFRKVCDKFLPKPFRPNELVAALNGSE